MLDRNYPGPPNITLMGAITGQPIITSYAVSPSSSHAFATVMTHTSTGHPTTTLWQVPLGNGEPFVRPTRVQGVKFPVVAHDGTLLFTGTKSGDNQRAWRLIDGDDYARPLTFPSGSHLRMWTNRMSNLVACTVAQPDPSAAGDGLRLLDMLYGKGNRPRLFIGRLEEQGLIDIRQLALPAPLFSSFNHSGGNSVAVSADGSAVFALCIAPDYLTTGRSNVFRIDTTLGQSTLLYAYGAEEEDKAAFIAARNLVVTSITSGSRADELAVEVVVTGDALPERRFVSAIDAHRRVSALSYEHRAAHPTTFPEQLRWHDGQLLFTRSHLGNKEIVATERDDPRPVRLPRQTRHVSSFHDSQPYAGADSVLALEAPFGTPPRLVRVDDWRFEAPNVLFDPALAKSPPHRTETVDTGTGYPLHYRLYLPEWASPSRPARGVIMAVHPGPMSSANMWRPNIIDPATYLAEGYATVVPEFGSSVGYSFDSTEFPWLRWQQFTHYELLCCVRDLYRHRDIDARHIHMVGQCFGGLMGLQAAMHAFNDDPLAIPGLRSCNIHATPIDFGLLADESLDPAGLEYVRLWARSYSPLTAMSRRRDNAESVIGKVAVRATYGIDDMHVTPRHGELLDALAGNATRGTLDVSFIPGGHGQFYSAAEQWAADAIAHMRRAEQETPSIATHLDPLPAAPVPVFLFAG